MSFRGGDRGRFNNRGRGHPRGAGGGSGGFNFAGGNMDRRTGANFNKPKICFKFQEGCCETNGCRDLHQYSYKNEIGRLQQIPTNSPVFASCLIQNSQVATALQGRIAVFDVQSAQKIFEFPVQGRVKSVNYSEEFGQGIIFFGGDTSNRQLLGAVLPNGTSQNFTENHTAGVNCLLIKNNLIFAGGDDAKVSVWCNTQQGFSFGKFLEIDPSLQNHITCLELVGNFLFAGLANGRIVGWEYNFNTNADVYQGALSLGHNGKVSSLISLNEAYLFSGGADGIVNCWDCSNQFQGGNLLNTTKNKPVQISQMILCELPKGTFLMIGTTQGKILWYSLQGSEAKFMQPLHYHRKSVTGVLKFSLQGHVGFISTSIDPIIHVNNWN